MARREGERYLGEKRHSEEENLTQNFHLSFLSLPLNPLAENKNKLQFKKGKKDHCLQHFMFRKQDC